MTTRNVLEHSVDHLAIRSLIDGYTDAVNRRDWATLETLFADDGVWDCGGPNMPAMTFRFEGAQGCARGIAGLIGSMSFVMQSNHAVTIEVSGDRASASSTINELAIAPGHPALTTIWGMYFDQIVRSPDGEWRFKERKFRFAWIDTNGNAGQVIAQPPKP
jgi:ketosteroid isomerase-like protein